VPSRLRLVLELGLGGMTPEEPFSAVVRLGLREAPEPPFAGR
jgi:hypothetical protein